MNNYYNNIEFWKKLDTMLVYNSMYIDNPKNVPNSLFPDTIMSVDYGYLEDIASQTKIKFFRGDEEDTRVSAIAVSFDFLSSQPEMKLIYGCSEKQLEEIMMFLNKTEYQKAIIINRARDEEEEW